MILKRKLKLRGRPAIYRRFLFCVLLIYFITSTIIPASATGYLLDWSHQFGTAGRDQSRGISLDTSENVYVVGWTGGALPNQISAGNDDAFIRKYSPAGSELWTRQFSGTSHDYAWATSADSSGNVFVAGYTVGRFPGLTPSGQNDVFVRKYDPDGVAVWTRQFGSSVHDFCEGAAVDSTGNLYLAGYTYGALSGQSSLGLQDAFVRKYDPDGNELWTRQFGTVGDDFGKRIAVDASNNVYVVGWTTDALPDQASSGNYDAYIRKYDSAGSEVWTRQFGTSGHDYAYALSLDSTIGVYVAGHTAGALPGQSWSGGLDGYVRKYSAAGDEIWTRQFGSSALDRIWNATSDRNGNVSVVGYTAGALPGQTSMGSNDAFAREYDPDGNEVWTRQFGSSGDDRGWAIAANPAGDNLYIAGDTSGTFPDQTLFGNIDVFLAKYGADVSSLELVISLLDFQSVSAGLNTWPGIDAKNKPATINANVAWKLVISAQTDFSGGGRPLPSSNLKMGPSYAQVADIMTTSSVQVASGAAGANLMPDLHSTLEIPWTDGLAEKTLSSTLTYMLLPQ